MSSQSRSMAAPAPARNGLPLRKLHHVAFDSHIIGATPDLEVKVRPDVLEEIDGPMLLHGLQGFRASLSRTSPGKGTG
jgi:hypothetical protein